MMRALALLAVLVLSACGFTPMYASGAQGGKGADVERGLGQIAIDVIPNAEGVVLRNHLIDRFYTDGYPAEPRYRLSVGQIAEDRLDFDITVESETTSRRLTLRTSFNLIDLQTGEAVLSRGVSGYASYNILGSQFTTRVSEKDSKEAALADMARQIETQVALYFRR